jgi:hypothetical protein
MLHVVRSPDGPKQLPLSKVGRNSAIVYFAILVSDAPPGRFAWLSCPSMAAWLRQSLIKF